MPNTLADLSKATPGLAEVQLAHMYHWAMPRSMGDARLPFTFAQMGATAEAAFDLVGRTVWEQFFGTVQITDEEICPLQLRQLVFRQLMAFSAVIGHAKHEALRAEEQQRLDDHAARLLKLREKLEAHNAHW